MKDSQRKAMWSKRKLDTGKLYFEKSNKDELVFPYNSQSSNKKIIEELVRINPKAVVKEMPNSLILVKGKPSVISLDRITHQLSPIAIQVDDVARTRHVIIFTKENMDRKLRGDIV